VNNVSILCNWSIFTLKILRRQREQAPAAKAVHAIHLRCRAPKRA
jgi:hypothetical protein